MNYGETFNRGLNALARKGIVLCLLLGLLPGTLLFYVVYVISVEPAKIAISDREKSVEVLEDDVRRGKGVELSEKAFKEEFIKVVSLFYESLPLLPKDTELANVLSTIQETARRNNVILTGLSAVKEGVKSPNATSLYEREIPAAVVGNYDDVMRFFLDTSRMTRILVVRDYSVISAKEIKGSVRPQYVSVQFSLLAFHAPPPSEFPNLPADVRSVVDKLEPVQTASNTVPGRSE